MQNLGTFESLRDCLDMVTESRVTAPHGKILKDFYNLFDQSKVHPYNTPVNIRVHQDGSYCVLSWGNHRGTSELRISDTGSLSVLDRDGSGITFYRSYRDFTEFLLER
jgi:hypothetical protein